MKNNPEKSNLRIIINHVEAELEKRKRKGIKTKGLKFEIVERELNFNSKTENQKS